MIGSRRGILVPQHLGEGLLEPVYGIVLGALILKDYQQLSTGFYSGAIIILAAVVAYPLLNRHLRRRRAKRIV